MSWPLLSVTIPVKQSSESLATEERSYIAVAVAVAVAVSRTPPFSVPPCLRGEPAWHYRAPADI